MNKKELLAKYNRISNDPQQARMFVEEMIDEISNIPTGTKLYKHKIKCVIGSGPATIEINVITNDSAQFTFQAGGPNKLVSPNNFELIMNGTDNVLHIDANQCVRITKSGSNLYLESKTTSDFIAGTGYFDSLESFNSDTVTEL